ncbi:MAG: response regulator [Thiohalobacteraceae bacterium]|nr:response regulator [Gammaproteobacteria bacterium]
MARPALLLVEDDLSTRQSLVRMTHARGYPVRLAHSPTEALGMLDDVAVVVADFRMAGMTGVEFLRCVRAKRPLAARYLLSRALGIANVRRAVSDGTAMAAFSQPWHAGLLLFAIRKGFECYCKHRAVERTSGAEAADYASLPMVHAAAAGGPISFRGQARTGAAAQGGNHADGTENWGEVDVSFRRRDDSECFARGTDFAGLIEPV